MMDKHIAEREERLKNAQKANDPTTMWRLISASMEAAFIQFLDLGKEEAKQMRGRGTVTIQNKKLQPETRNTEHTTLEKTRRRGAEHAVQANRRMHTARRMSAIAKDNLSKGQEKSESPA